MSTIAELIVPPSLGSAIRWADRLTALHRYMTLDLRYAAVVEPIAVQRRMRSSHSMSSSVHHHWLRGKGARISRLLAFRFRALRSVGTCRTHPVRFRVTTTTDASAFSSTDLAHMEFPREVESPRYRPSPPTWMHIILALARALAIAPPPEGPI
ncbi:hypothetical protein BV20DRAFT_37059 [Pilatotrama ljubarskyi]|nr:hypothetical protein BV20DRAFT_37059 [Pilatotrama ljubarskyi]